jgi:hypothetical protein
MRVFVLIAMALIFCNAPARAAGNADAQALFVRFVAAQNAHDADAVRGMLWNSPTMLWYTRGKEFRGPDAVVRVLHDYFAGTWHLDPDLSAFETTTINDATLQVLVPVVFTRGDPGQVPQQNRFLIVQTYTLTADGWRVASIFALANTQLK